MSTPLVFIHGIKGSKLVDTQGRCQWVTALQALALETPKLALPMSFKNGIQARDELRAVEPLSIADCQSAYRDAFPEEPGDRIDRDVAAAIAQLEACRLILPQPADCMVAVSSCLSLS